VVELLDQELPGEELRERAGLLDQSRVLGLKQSLQQQEELRQVAEHDILSGRDVGQQLRQQLFLLGLAIRLVNGVD